LLGGLATLLLGIVFLYNSYELTLGRFSKPGPGLWPFILSALMIGLSILLLISTYKINDYEKFSAKAKYPAYSCIVIAAYISLFDVLGAIISSLLLLIFWIRFLGKESWYLSIVVASGITALIYLLFIVGLDLPLPAGLLTWRWNS